MIEVTFLIIAEALLQLSMIMMIGLYFIFSNTVVPVLSKHSTGAEIMRQINEKILNKFFLICFCVSGIAGLYFFYYYSGLKSLSGLIFFVGTTLITAFFNVPLNNQLRDAAPDKISIVWESYITKWLFWNNVRTVSSIVCGLLLSLESAN